MTGLVATTNPSGNLSRESGTPRQMDQWQVTMPPPPHRTGGGRGIAVEMSRALTIVLPWQYRGNTRGLLYIGKKGREMKR